MKKLISILCLVMVVAIMPGCTKKYITPNPNKTVLFNVPSSAWTLSSDGHSYFTVIDAPEIDSYFNEYGGVLVYLSFSNGVYEQIPQVYDGVAYSYTHNQGAVVLYAQTPDGVTPIKPASSKLKLLLIDSNE